MAHPREQVFDLAVVVQELRSQLNQAMSDGANDPIKFELGPVELEFEVVVTRERGAEGGLKVSVLSLGAKGTRSRGKTHRMKFVLTPQDSQGQPQRISDSERTLPRG
ncbi:trypco2 family protein [Streptomyces poriferorum]|uniref:Trypsin-co-occurring domain-containing protein n=1 Tax=Streptomyces poriferorum TaxID=2798799 RepID=A0ABY9IFJ0_9ACTN|nr:MULTISPECIES: trypco2 family protein [unclassified Streptomyces]MDP5315596.1 hypothetical protein [Streptomyces sp. Alt4]WLQ53972.1 hypothetical protein P8A19_00160 [Streptomyces sp. Alt2]